MNYSYTNPQIKMLSEKRPSSAMGKNGHFNKWLGQMDSHIQNYELGPQPLGYSFLDTIPKV